MAHRVWYRRRPSPGTTRAIACLAALVVVAGAVGAPLAQDFLNARGSGGAVLAARDAAPSNRPAATTALASVASPAPSGVAAEAAGTAGGANLPVSRPPSAAALRAIAYAGETERRSLLGERWPTTPALLSGYRWPLPHGRITGGFGPSWAGELLVDGDRFHDGLDLATFCGDHVVAAHDGVVLAVGRRVDPWLGWVGSLAPSEAHRDARGLWGVLAIMVIVDDGNGYRSVYAHFNAVAVHTGDVVHAGQFIGWEGSTGAATGCHLHYGLFSPTESATMRLRPDIARQTKLPDREIARIDPLEVLPPR